MEAASKKKISMKDLEPSFKRFTIPKIVIIIVLTALFVGVINTSTAPIKQILNCQSDDKTCQSDKRIRSITSIVTSLSIGVIVIAAIASVLNVAGVHTGSILAGAGIIGLVIGLGAQSVIKDVVTGILIISENQISVGDYISVMNVEGKVVSGQVFALSVRIIKIKGTDGSLSFVPSGNILHITNFSRANQVVTVVIQLPLEADIRSISEIFQEECGELYRDPNIKDLLVSAPELLGAKSLGGTYYTLEIQATVPSGSQWAIGNYIRLQVVQRLQQLQINPKVYVNISGSPTVNVAVAPTTEYIEGGNGGNGGDGENGNETTPHIPPPTTLSSEAARDISGLPKPPSQQSEVIHQDQKIKGKMTFSHKKNTTSEGMKFQPGMKTQVHKMVSI